ncbi:serine/threonine-protein kinase-like protein acr4 [Phtheirospermum japonicum]|uniref:non-specific serine/threonine protein kinase n=1 Tax=Phtheirospermum japonicum TaxID=374723 RepID=A0A830DA05_9LAMI|nr:serine/threonine-protein kinase-like protein acr4 [Phtheirospermum japonicum]
MFFLLFFSFLSEEKVSSLGSMSSIAVSYGEKGSVFCLLKPDGSNLLNCHGSNPSVIHAIPSNVSFLGLTAGSGFVCGLLMDLNLPFCWGSTSFVPMGVALKRDQNSGYSEISAGDNHLCGLRKAISKNSKNTSVVDCWGYNMTKTYHLDGEILSISAGSVFNCVLFASNRNVFCWGDETAINAIGSIPVALRLKKISTGGYHVCGILEEFCDKVFCRGRSLEPQRFNVLTLSDIYSAKLNFVSPPKDPMVSVVGGKFHACGIRSYDRVVVCWGYSVETSTPPPRGVKLHELAAGDYFTCGISSKNPRSSPICWGVNVPHALPLPVSPEAVCKSTPCAIGFYEFNNASAPCSSPGSHLCLSCSKGCPNEMYQTTECGSTSDRQCGYNCSNCSSDQCISSCFSGSNNIIERFWSLQFPIVMFEICFAVLLIIVVLFVTVLYVRYKLRICKCSLTSNGNGSFDEGVAETQPVSDELKIRKAEMFTYEELERATNGFKEELLVGKGSFSCVYKGVLKDGTVVAVKRAIESNDPLKYSKEFLTELDLLSRLNHAHLLNLLGYCDEGDERLLVYEFMANGSLYQHLHCKSKELKEQLDWIKRVTITIQASRGIEYLHGYACPPVIHRDIKSSNILIDEENNARVADFGLSLLVPTNSRTPLSELPAGTLGYLDPEYYRLHYLTTKSDVYSFGVLLLEILSGRKAIDMNYEQGNIVEWAVPLIKCNNLEAILDPVLKHPSDLEALGCIANVASKCVRMRGKERPSMDRVTTALERALAILIGGPCGKQSILPSEVVLGSTRLHKKPSQRSIIWPSLATKDGRITEFRPPSWTTYSSGASSERRRSSFCDSDVDGNNVEAENVAIDGPTSLVEEIEPASPQRLFLQHNF